MLEIKTSKISNTVTFTVDKQSLKAAKDSIEEVQKFAEKIEPSFNMIKIKKQFKDLEDYAKRVQQAMSKLGSGIPPVPPVPPPGTPPAGNPPPPPRGGGGKGGGSGGAAAALKKRQDMISLKTDNFAFQSSKYNKADLATLTQANHIIAQTTQLYEQEKITLQRMNQVMAHQLDNIRRSHRAKNREIEDEVRGRRRVKRELENEAKLRMRLRERERKAKEREERRDRDARARDRARRYDRMREGALGLSPTMLGSSLLGAGAFAGISRLTQALSDAATRINLVSRGAQNVQANPNAVLTMKTWGEVNGVDSANYIKAIDNLKDVRERLGNTMMASKLDPKTGKYKGGDNGINDIMNEFGWSKEDIAKFQNNPLDFVQATVNAGQAKGMNSAQIGRLMENLGDDLMHYQRMFMDNGKEYIDTLKMLQQYGGTFNEEIIEAGQNFVEFRAKMNAVGEGFSNNMLVGFMDALKGAPEFSQNVGIIMASAQELGKSLGEMASAVGWLVSLLPGSSENKHEKLSEAGWYYDDSAFGHFWNKFRGDPNAPVGATDKNQVYGTSSDLGGWNGYGTNPEISNPYSGLKSSLGTDSVNSRTYAPMKLTNTVEIPEGAFNINIIPDGSGFSNFLDARFDTSFTNFTQGLTLAVTGGQSTSGN